MKTGKRILLLLLLLGICGCRRAREPRTVLLPERETQGENVESSEEEAYTVRKIYTESYEGFPYEGFNAFLPGCKEHQIRLIRNGEEEFERLVLDYRYGFYEAESFWQAQIETVGLTIMNWADESPESQILEQNFISPDGRYMIYLDMENSYIGVRLLLMELETGQSVTLLDGDELNCPMDQFMIQIAWDPDSTMLCYGFYPRNVDAWKDYGAGKCIFYYMDLESKRIVNRLNYSYASLTGIDDNLETSRLYIDRDGQKLLTALVRSCPEPESQEVELFPQQISQSGEMETEGVVPPHRMNFMGGEAVCLDAGNERMFLKLKDGITVIDSECNIIDMIETEEGTSITNFLALNGGQVFITSEYTDYMGTQDICIYRKNGEQQTVKRVLFKNAGYVMHLQYDPVYRRILAEVQEPLENQETEEKKGMNSKLSGTPRTAIVLEF